MKSFSLLLGIMFLLLGHPGSVFAQTPFGGTPHQIPGIIEIEHFDTGGQGIGYFDVDTQNRGDGGYRTGEGVDIWNIPEDGAGGTYSVWNMAIGEWLQYTVNVEQADTYEVKIRGNLADYQSNISYTLSIDNTPITDTAGNPTFSNFYGEWGWKGWSTTPKPTEPKIYVNLSPGIHTLRLNITGGSETGGDHNGLNYLVFENSSANTYSSLTYPSPALGPTYYVSPSGSDTHPGTISQPWKTLTHAANTAIAGDTVYVRTGTYSERLVPAKSGAPGNFIIFAAYPGDQPVINGSGVSIPQLAGLVDLTKKSYLQISGFRITNTQSYWQSGIAIDQSHHIIIDHNLVDNIYSSGISTSRASHHVLIDSNELTNTNTGQDDTEVSLGTYWFAHNIEITGNYLHDTYGEGIGVAASPHHVRVHHNRLTNHGLGFNWGRGGIGIYIDSWTEYQYENQVYNNTVYDNGSEGISVANEGGGLLENVKVFNNILYNTGWMGQIGVANWSNTQVTGSEYHPLKNVFIYNNTLYRNESFFGDGGIFINNWDIDNIVIKNNILDSGSCSQHPSYTNNGVCYVDVNCNLLDPVNGCTNLNSVVVSSNNLYGQTPRFINPSAADFHLQSNSPAIDSADPVINASFAINAPATDFDDHGRPAGSGYDIGAFEYGSSPAVSPTPGQPDPADIDGDLDVDIFDYNQIIEAFSSTVNSADLNGDGAVNLLDLNLLLQTFGS